MGYETGDLRGAISKIADMAGPPARPLAAGANIHGAQATMHERDDHDIVRLPLGFRRLHTLADPLSLAAWLTREANPRLAEVIVNTDEVVALVSGRDIEADVVSVKLTEHPVWARWKPATRAMPHKAFHKLLRAAVVDTRELPRRGDDSYLSQGERLLAEMGKIEVKGATSFTQHIDERGLTTLAAADAKQSIESRIPAEIRLYVPIFVDVEVGGVAPHYEIRALVETSVVDGKPFFSLEFPDLALVMLEARKDVAACLRERLGEGWLVVLGEARQEVVVLQRAPCRAYVHHVQVDLAGGPVPVTGSCPEAGSGDVDGGEVAP